MEQYEEINELVSKIKEGDNEALEALIEREMPMIKSIVSKLGWEKEGTLFREDLYQTGRIALYNAALAYDVSREASFTTFAYTGIRLQCLSAIRRERRFSNSKLNLDDTLEYFIDGLTSYPIDKVVQDDAKETRYLEMKTVLSEKELEFLSAYADGFKGASLAQKMNMEAKKVDNTLQGIKRKLYSLFIK